MKTPESIEHFDRLGQPIRIGEHVAFSWSGNTNVSIGTVTKLTAKRIRIAWTSSYVHNGEQRSYSGVTVKRPVDCLILGSGLPQHLTMATLQKKI